MGSQIRAYILILMVQPINQNNYKCKNHSKNMLDCLVGYVAFWAVGFAVANGNEGGNEFMGVQVKSLMYATESNQFLSTRIFAVI